MSSPGLRIFDPEVASPPTGPTCTRGAMVLAALEREVAARAAARRARTIWLSRCWLVGRWWNRWLEWQQAHDLADRLERWGPRLAWYLRFPREAQPVDERDAPHQNARDCRTWETP